MCVTLSRTHSRGLVDACLRVGESLLRFTSSVGLRYRPVNELSNGDVIKCWMPSTVGRCTSFRMLMLATCLLRYTYARGARSQII